ncbi:type II methionyl aminopeptidase [Candidatus Woesearchaeota archaeon]|nr:type II methionyl aminopeptidase [Candidatus Woesearchaeota archaeon]
MYSKEEIDTWRKAARIAAQVLDYGKGLVKNGASYLEVSDKIDQKIYDLGAKPAWATQISFDHVAAHQCAEFDDERVFDNNLVKIDVGVRIDGFIGDNAATIDLSGQYKEICDASREALKAAEKVLCIGATLDEIGRTIQETIMSYGLSPIRNLSGHTISHEMIHDHPSIPNIATGDQTALEDGQVIAVEPFATNGDGQIYESEQANLFSLINTKAVRSPFAREILAYVDQEYEIYPFTTRWLAKKFGLGKTRLALRELLRVDNVQQHPPLVERAKGMVAQFEHTYRIGDKVEKLTVIE